MDRLKVAKFSIGQVVRHRIFPFRGVIFDVDPEFDNTEEWYQAIPAEVRPRKDQPFYHLFAENAETEYVAYVSEQNLLVDDTGEPVRHPQVREYFESFDPKPALEKYNGRNPKELLKVEPTQFDKVGNMLASPWKFSQRGRAGSSRKTSACAAGSRAASGVEDDLDRRHRAQREIQELVRFPPGGFGVSLWRSHVLFERDDALGVTA